MTQNSASQRLENVNAKTFVLWFSASRKEDERHKLSADVERGAASRDFRVIGLIPFPDGSSES
ncbi:hypothetical protein GCM10011326_47180 [Salipiger profundus]|nr:hypothetical protein GCM10011326_47180 [Salipiger profundus]